jgi:hypothetical protein
MNQIQASYQIPVLLNTSEGWRYNEKCFRKKVSFQMIL